MSLTTHAVTEIMDTVQPASILSSIAPDMVERKDLLQKTLQVILEKSTQTCYCCSFRNVIQYRTETKTFKQVHKKVKRAV